MNLRLSALPGLFFSVGVALCQATVGFHAADPPGASAAPAEVSSLRDVLGDTPQERRLEQSLRPYLAAFEAAGKPAVRLVPGTTNAHPEYMVGDDLVVLPPEDTAASLQVTLPEGVWVNALTGAQSSGGTQFEAEVPDGSVPLWERGGSVLERCNKACTEAQAPKWGVVNSNPDACLQGCLVDVLPPFNAEFSALVKDAGGRVLTRSGDTLTIAGKPAHMTVRWRFARIRRVMVNGTPAKLQSSAYGYYITLNHAERSRVTWEVAQDRVRFGRRSR